MPEANDTELHRRRLENGTSLIGVSASAANASWIASSVRLRADALAAIVPSSCVSRSSLTPGAGSACTTRSEASVSVPVLSTQIVSTDASDSIALSCCASTPRRDIRTAPAA